MIREFREVTPGWLSRVLGSDVRSVELKTSSSNWASNAVISAVLASGEARSFWLKLCLGDTFGRSEVNYYLRDYVDLEGAPLVRCYDACYEEGVGYHILLDDVSGTFRDRKEAEPTLEHGLALAEAIAKLHAHHWEKQESPGRDKWDPYWAQVSPGVEPLEVETGLILQRWFAEHAEKLMARWGNPTGLTLLHGDINPTNVLTPKEAELPIFILDRQPFEWAITYGLAVYDLAYAIVPWWPFEFRVGFQEQILRRWYECLGQPGYSWEQVQSDWELSVQHCLHVPIEWCREPGDLERMRGLWQWQLGNITGAAVGRG